jgi:hypothetical protein
VCTIAAALLAMASVCAISTYDYYAIWTPLQRLYWSAYLRSGVALTTTGPYDLLNVVTQTGSRLALEEEVVPVVSATGVTTLALSDAAGAAGAVRLTWQHGRFRHRQLHAFLGHWIYRDQSLADVLTPALWGGGVVLMVLLAAAIPMDRTRTRHRKDGRRLKGPELVTARAFNRRHRSPGLAFDLHERRTVSQRLRRERPRLCLPTGIEASHLLLMGDTGTGKSSGIRQILLHIAACGDTAIVYDPAREYIREFYDPDRGDVVLNPLDQRMPYWTPGDEWRHEAETLTLAASLFPDRPREIPFFTEAPRKIFAHLLTFRPSPQELAWWMCHEDEIDRRLRGTEFAALVDRQAPAQRGGVLGSLNLVADAVKLLPTEEETSAHWSALAWARERTGWVFLTSTPDSRKRLVPLTSLWLDTLVLRLMTPHTPGSRRVWFVLDELASLQRLPQLQTAITENRKSNNPVVLGFQGRSQLETRYGHDAETMLSQPATKIFLRTSEARAAKWISDTIGEVEIERVRESRSTGHADRTRTSRSDSLERHVEPLVMASEITGLPNLHGYLKTGNLVVRLRLPFIERPATHPDLIERPLAARRSGAPLSARPSGDSCDAAAQTLEPQRLAHDPFFW